MCIYLPNLQSQGPHKARVLQVLYLLGSPPSPPAHFTSLVRNGPRKGWDGSESSGQLSERRRAKIQGALSFLSREKLSHGALKLDSVNKNLDSLLTSSARKNPMAHGVNESDKDYESA